MMRRWLVTIAPSQLRQAISGLRDLGCQVQPEAAVEVDDDTVLPVSGPDTVQGRLADVPGVKAVHEDSDLTLY